MTLRSLLPCTLPGLVVAASLSMSACSDFTPPSRDGSGEPGEDTGVTDPTDTGLDPDADDPGDTPVEGDVPSGDIDRPGDVSGTDTVEEEPPGWPDEGLFFITLDASGRGTFEGTFADQPALPDLAWARAPGVACWSNPTRDEFYANAHVAIALTDPIGPWHEITVTVTPTTERGDASFYVLEQGARQFDVPPAVSSVPFCHAPVTFGGPGEASTLTFRTYSEASRNFLIGVANRGRLAADGNFRVEVEARPLPEAERCYAGVDEPHQWPPQVQQIALNSEGSWAGTGDFAQGALPCSLDFLDEQTCVPRTQFVHFEGNHVFYALQEPLPRDSVLTITVTPDPGVNVSLYGATQGTTFFALPPSFEVGRGCDSNLSHPTRNPGSPQRLTFITRNNPFNVFFAVAADGEQGTEGGYTLAIDRISTSTDDCTEADYNRVRGLDAWPADVTRIAVDPSTGVGSARGDLMDGEFPCTLDWSERSSVACFPAVQWDYFSGRHRYFAIDPPPPAGSNVFVTVYPDPGVDVNLFGYRNGPEDYIVPPLVPGAINCEASYPRTVFTTEANPGRPESITFLNPTPNRYGYFLGVAGYLDGALDGGFTIEVVVEEPPPPFCPESLPGATWPTWPSAVQRVALNAAGEASGRGDLAAGRCVNLSWAARSDIACFPATRFDRFEGNHIFYALDLPLPPRSELEIVIEPDPGVEVNAYALLMGEGEFLVPPAVTSTVCRSSYGLAGPNPGEPEVLRIQNPTPRGRYNILFAVAGDGTTGRSGGFRWRVRQTEAEVQCPASLEAPPVTDTLPPSVTRINLTSDKYTGTHSLSSGSCMNLDFAAQSDVACFPATRFDRFEGSHVFFELVDPLEPNSFVDIEVRPRGGADVNLYAFSLGDATWPQLPPRVNNAICEASYGLAGPNPGETERVQFRNPPSNRGTFRILIAVAGPTGVTEADFDLSISRVRGQTQCEASLPGETFSAWPARVTRVALPSAGASTRVSGSTSTGSCVNLDFASRSDVACFPATQNGFFDGDHVFYALDAPLPPRSEIEVTLAPGASEDLNLYGMMMGSGEFIVPPRVTPVVCNASNPSLFEGPNPGVTERIRFQNPSWTGSFNILIGVADGSAAPVTTGNFELTIRRTADLTP
jgi:hypothetical protein